MKIRLDRENPATFFVRVRGPRGVRELRAILDTGSTLCTIPITDARELGYATFYDPIVNKGEGVYTVSLTGIMDLEGLTLEEVAVAGLSSKDVAAVACHLPRLGGIDVILGVSFLKHFKITLDYENGWLNMEQVGVGGENDEKTV